MPHSSFSSDLTFRGISFTLVITECPAPWGRSSVGRALEWHSRGRGFDSHRLHHSTRGEPPLAHGRPLRYQQHVTRVEWCPELVEGLLFVQIRLAVNHRSLPSDLSLRLSVRVEDMALRLGPSAVLRASRPLRKGTDPYVKNYLISALTSGSCDVICSRVEWCLGVLRLHAFLRGRQFLRRLHTEPRYPHKNSQRWTRRRTHLQAPSVPSRLF